VAAWAILQEARRRANLTQRELAEVAGRPQSTISKIERGRRDPTLTTLRELVRAAGFDLRFQLVPRDEHDRQLMDAMLALSPEERLARLEGQAEAFALMSRSRVAPGKRERAGRSGGSAGRPTCSTH
jgi:transcriptional regulator with XRE-family HTH domain